MVDLEAVFIVLLLENWDVLSLGWGSLWPRPGADQGEMLVGMPVFLSA
jgi:hypothetical protein